MSYETAPLFAFMLQRTEDALESPKAFAKKRKPEWKMRWAFGSIYGAASRVVGQVARGYPASALRMAAASPRPLDPSLSMSGL